MSMYTRNPGDETWFVHAPVKNQKRAVVTAPPPSNIPYLNGILDGDAEKKPQEIWFRESDSDFVRLSKLGGRQDLLIHKQTTKKREPTGYPIVPWWTDMYHIENKEKQQSTHKFQIPAWFAHQDSLTDMKKEPIPIVRGHSVDAKQLKRNDIQEPLKYGQLRNYLYPVHISSNRSKTFFK